MDLASNLKICARKIKISRGYSTSINLNLVREKALFEVRSIHFFVGPRVFLSSSSGKAIINMLLLHTLEFLTWLVNKQINENSRMLVAICLKNIWYAKLRQHVGQYVGSNVETVCGRL